MSECKNGCGSGQGCTDCPPTGQQQHLPPYQAAWQQVTCAGCKRSFQCTPWDDYYNATNDHDGVCERCLVTGAGLDPDRTVRLPDA